MISFIFPPITKKHFLATTFLEKCKNTWALMHGRFWLVWGLSLSSEEKRSIPVGIFDCLTLGCCFLGSVGTYLVRRWADRFAPSLLQALPIYILVVLPICIIEIITGLIRIIGSTLLTIAALPLIGIVHLVSKIIAYQDQKIVTFSPQVSSEYYRQSNPITSAEYLQYAVEGNNIRNHPLRRLVVKAPENELFFYAKVSYEAHEAHEVYESTDFFLGRQSEITESYLEQLTAYQRLGVLQIDEGFQNKILLDQKKAMQATLQKHSDLIPPDVAAMVVGFIPALVQSS